MDDAGEDKDGQGVRIPPTEEVREEIERAIDNAKRTPGDKWFRRQFYRAAAQRRRRLEAGRQPELAYPGRAMNDDDRKG